MPRSRPGWQPETDLTSTERTASSPEFANHIAGGASNPDIARTLFLSRKTVERHVSSMLGKLEVKNRAQLAARIAAGDGGR